MYLLGGFDGSRLNDMHCIALPLNLHEEDSLRINSRPPTSGSIMSTHSELDYESEIEEKKVSYDMDLANKVELLQQQVNELQSKLHAEEERDDMCKICYSKEIDTVFLDCAHRISCSVCASNIRRCPFCRKDIVRTVRTFNV